MNPKDNIIGLMMSINKIALLFISGGVVFIFALFGSSLSSLFQDSVTEVATVKLKQGQTCIIEPSDRIPRTIENCGFVIGDNLSVTYKPKQPSFEKYEPAIQN